MTKHFSQTCVWSKKLQARATFVEQYSQPYFRAVSCNSSSSDCGEPCSSKKKGGTHTSIDTYLAQHCEKRHKENKWEKKKKKRQTKERLPRLDLASSTQKVTPKLFMDRQPDFFCCIEKKNIALHTVHARVTHGTRYAARPNMDDNVPQACPCTPAQRTQSCGKPWRFQRDII